MEKEAQAYVMHESRFGKRENFAYKEGKRVVAQQQQKDIGDVFSTSQDSEIHEDRKPVLLVKWCLQYQIVWHIVL